jgi:hypothetical protein
VKFTPLRARHRRVRLSLDPDNNHGQLVEFKCAWFDGLRRIACPTAPGRYWRDMEGTRSDAQKGEQALQAARARPPVPQLEDALAPPAATEFIGRLAHSGPGDPPPPIDPRQIAALQGVVGNRTTSALVVARQPAPAPATPAPAAAPAGLIQRYTVPGEFTLSGGGTVITDRPGANAALRTLAFLLTSRGEELDAEGERMFLGMAKTVQAEADKYTGEGELTEEDAGKLGSFLDVVRWTASAAFQSAMTRTADKISSLFATGNELDSALEDLDEAAHLQFIAQNQDELGKVLAAITRANDLASKIKDYAGKATKLKDYTSGLGAFDGLAKMAEKLKSGSGQVSDLLGKAKDIMTTARNIGTLAGVANTSNGTAMMQSIGQFEAAIGLVDKTVGKFGKEVPVFGDLWSKWYKPMTDACIKSLKVIAKAEEREGRMSEVAEWLMNPESPRDPCGAPLIGAWAELNRYFPGGQPVLNYLYVLRHGGAPAMNDTVRDYFLDRTDLFNAGGGEDKLEESEWKLLSPETWWRSGRANNVATWLRANVNMVWGVLYGDVGHYIN